MNRYKEKIAIGFVVSMVIFTVMAGTAMAGNIAHTSPAAVTLNIQSNEVKTVTYTVTGSDARDIDFIGFNITAISSGASPADLKAQWQPAGAWGQTGEVNVPSGPSCSGVINLTDNGDSNDAAQDGYEYQIIFTAYNGSTPIDGTEIYLGASTTFVTAAIPEFATIALPALAVLGLFMFFNRRRNQK